MLLTVDAGNSSVGMAVFEGDAIIHHHTAPSDDFSAESLSPIMKLYRGKMKGIMVASVVPDLNHRLTGILGEMWRMEPVFVHHQMDLGFSLKIDRPETLGADRIANCSGGMFFSRPPFIIVDSGTATNFEVVNRNGEFIGGAIFPGIRMGIDAMSQRAAQLEEVPFFVPESPVGKSTPDCMRSGVYHAQLGGIGYLIEQYKKIVGDAAVFATGGGINHFITELGDTVIHKPHLIFYGMKRIFDRIT